MTTQRRGLSNFAIILQVATFSLAGLGYWGSLQKDNKADALAVEHRFSVLESKMDELQDRVERMSQWLRQPKEGSK